MKIVLKAHCVVMLILMPAAVIGAPPVLHFSDLTWGPKRGWEGSPNQGAAITIWGQNFGSTRGSSYVTANGAQLLSDTDYAEWGATGPARGLQRITFWLNARCADGAGSITLTVNGLTSNSLPFTVAPGTIYFIAPAGNNGSNGLYSTARSGRNGPFRDIYMFNPGVDGQSRGRNPSGDGQYIVYVRGGTYTTLDVESSFVALRGPYGGPGKQKALIGYPGETPVIDTAKATRGVVWTANYDPYGFIDYLTFSKLSLVNGAIALGAFGSYTRIIGCSFTNYLDNVWAGVVSVGDAKYTSIFGNLFDHNGYDSYKHNIYIKTGRATSGVDLSTLYTYVGWNEFSNAVARDTRGGVIFVSRASDVPAYYTQYVYIHDNYFHDGNMDFVYVGDSVPIGDVYVYNNIFSGGTSTNGGMTLYDGTNNIYVYNNTFYQSGAATAAMVSQTGSAQAYFKNNIWCPRLGQRVLRLETFKGARATFDHDLFSTSEPSGGGITVTNRIVGDPQFVSPANGNFHLLRTSPAIGAGTSSVANIVARDYDGSVRQQSDSFDVGALQYVKPVLASLTCNPSVILTPGSTSCRLGVSGEASEGGLQLATASDDPRVTVPSSVFLPAGSTSVDMQVDAAAVNARTAGTISANLSGSGQTFELWLLPATSPAVLAVVNGASYRPGSIAPGEIVTAFGFNMGPENLVGAELAGGRYANVLAASAALFDNTPAPLLLVQANQVNAVVPYAVAGKSDVSLEIDVGGRRSNPLRLTVARTAPGVFTTQSSGQGQGVVVNEDGSLNSSSNPAQKGSVITFYAVGFGQTEPPGVDGLPAGEPLARPLEPVSVRIGGRNADLLYAGAAPGFIAGLHQINARVPEDADPGAAVGLVVVAGGFESQPGVTLGIQ